jgi:hypothetical protein
MSFGLRDLVVKMSPKGGDCPAPSRCRGSAIENPCTPTNIVDPCGPTIDTACTPTDNDPCAPTNDPCALSRKNPGRRKARDAASALEALRLQLRAALSR